MERAFSSEIRGGPFRLYLDIGVISLQPELGHDSWRYREQQGKKNFNSIVNFQNRGDRRMFEGRGKEMEKSQLQVV